MISQLLKPKDLAVVLGISLSAAYTLMRNGEIESIRFGRTARVKSESLEKFLQDHSSWKKQQQNKNELAN
jgi:excisionase family DNA binding protein